METFVTEGGRNAVAQLLREHVGLDARLLHDGDGAPLLAGSPLHLSISHSPHYAAITLDAESRIGVDIEEPRMEQLHRVISKFLTPDETPEWEPQLLRAWTAKEATFKAAGISGLTIGQIRLVAPDVAQTPDGREFLLDFTETPQYTLTTAEPLSAKTLYERGRRYMKFGNHSAALSDFNRSAALDPDGPGTAAAQHLNQIFDFFNPDIYNP